MVERPATRDLFGRPVRQRRPRYEAALQKADTVTLPERAVRARWLAKIVPRHSYFMMPLETYYILREAKSSFIQGSYVATLVLATSFVEHWLTSHLTARGHAKEASRGLSACIQVARNAELVDRVILDKVDRLRLLRNPFVHLKNVDHEYRIDHRSIRSRLHPDEVLGLRLNHSQNATVAARWTAERKLRASLS